MIGVAVIAVVMVGGPVAAADAPAAGSFTPEPFSATRVLDVRERIEESDGRALILSPAAFYRFRPIAEAWTVTTSDEGLPGTPFLGQFNALGNLWIFGTGASVSDLRFDDWQRYQEGEGYPGRIVHDVEADEDYAYAGTDVGVARFDQFILEWETLVGPDGEMLGPCIDVAVGIDRVWFGLEGGVAEYYKETEGFFLSPNLGQLETPRVLALRQTTRAIWALTPVGIARYDKSLRSWTSFQPGVDLPDARVHSLVMEGDDIWLGTDDGLWRFQSDTGIWRRHESNAEMPGRRVLALELEPEKIWVVTEQAFAVYDRESARWIDFTANVPLEPHTVSDMALISETLIYYSDETIVYGLGAGRDNPSLFTYRSQPVLQAEIDEEPGRADRWQVGLDDTGLAMRMPRETTMNLKGGATVFIEDHDGGQSGNTGLGELIHETRLDLTLAGRFGQERSLSGFYDNTTDPDNPGYQITYRGSRSDELRLVSAGEIEQQIFNSNLVPGTGLLGGRLWGEVGGRTETTRRRMLTADAWVGDRRTYPGRDTFFGGNRTVTGQTRDVDYVPGQIFSLPDGWTVVDFNAATYYLDDNDAATDDANTEDRVIAGRAGAWDLLRPNVDLVFGPGGRTLILNARLEEDHALAAVATTTPPSGIGELDLTDDWLRNHYWIAQDPVPGSLSIAIVDTTGSDRDATGTSYLEVFGLDRNGDGILDPERFSPITGLLAFPDERPFPPEVYAEPPLHIYAIEYVYQASLNTFQLSHRHVVPRSESILVDRVLLTSDVDYSILPSSGLFILYEHVLLNDDTVIEVEYLYEIGTGRAGAGADTAGTVVAGQVGLAPSDHFYGAVNTTHWDDAREDRHTTAGFNTRFEWKAAQYLFRLSPELAWSQTTAGNARTDHATGVSLQGRYRGLELNASQRSLGAEFTSFEDRRTLLGRLREETNARGQLFLGDHFQTDVTWYRALSDRVPARGAFDPRGGTGGQNDSTVTGRGEESSFMGTVRYLRSGWPNVRISRGRILLDAPAERQEKQISRAELELSPTQAGVNPLGIRRLWLRAFIQRTERRLEDKNGGTPDSLQSGTGGKRNTDHAFVRLNGSVGAPLSWNASFEDRYTYLPESTTASNLRRVQGVDATLQTQPHSSVDAYLRWESNRDQSWHPEGGSGGFGVRRFYLATLQLYPGRVATYLSRVSFRFDFGGNESEDGEPGVGLPGAGSLWGPASDFSLQRRTRNQVLEARVQVLPRLRWIARLETERDRMTREGASTDQRGRRLENRFEIRPRGGLVTLRLIGSDTESISFDEDELRFSGQWDQAWKHGFLTFLSLDAEDVETRDRNVGDVTQQWTPLARLTYRRPWWQLDASVAGSTTWARTRDTSIGATGDWFSVSQRTVATSLSLNPWRIFAIKMQYTVVRSQSGGDSSGSGSRVWETDHDLRLRLQIRA